MKKGGARLGQHFLTNPHYAEILVREAKVSQNDIVLEIGPGEGMLTRVLLNAAKTVVAVEKDEALAEKLHGIFASEIADGRLKVVTADIRDTEPESLGLRAGEYMLAANIPYYITGELLRKFLEADAQPKTLAFLMQKEVAQRILSEKESILSVSVKAYGTPRIAAKVSKGNFNPPPKVDSAILMVENISKKNFDGVSEEHFFEVVRTGFASKRKLLASNLSVRFPKEVVETAFQELTLDKNLRAENLHLGEWLKLAKKVSH